jgi:hypothetical protein
LNPQDLAAAWSYYSENSAEIESIIAQDND